MNKKGDAVSLGVLTLAITTAMVVNAYVNDQLDIPTFESKPFTVDTCIDCPAHGPIPAESMID